MILCRKPLILVTDLVGGLLLTAVAAIALLGFVLPALNDLGSLPELHRRITDSTRRRDAQTARNAASAVALSDLERRLADAASQSPTELGALLEFIARQARDTNVRIQEIEPAPLVAGDGFDVTNVVFRASGGFPDFQELLRRIEARSVFLQIPRLSILTARGVRPDQCQLEWTVRISHPPDNASTQLAEASP